MKIRTETVNIIDVMSLDEKFQAELLGVYGSANDSSFWYPMEYVSKWDDPWQRDLLSEYVAAGGKEGDSVLMEVCW